MPGEWSQWSQWSQWAGWVYGCTGVRVEGWTGRWRTKLTYLLHGVHHGPPVRRKLPFERPIGGEAAEGVQCGVFRVFQFTIITSASFVF